MTASARIATEIESLPGVETGPGRFGSLRFTLGRRELGHLHGDRIADLPLRHEDADAIIATGHAVPHRYTPEGSGWVTIELAGDDDVERVIELMRATYERAVRSPIARRSTPPSST